MTCPRRTGSERPTLLRAILADLPDVAPLRFTQRCHSPIVDHQNVDSAEPGQETPAGTTKAIATSRQVFSEDFAMLLRYQGAPIPSGVCFLLTSDRQYAVAVTSPKPRIYELKVTLVGIDPPVWRRIQAPSTILLRCLHEALQVAMGWTNSHLHQFEKSGKLWGVPGDDEFEDRDVLDESKTPVAAVLRSEGDSMVYVYDFGDDWRHEVVLEKIVQSEVPMKPICLAGERHCPPEDVGGVSGYQDFLEIIFDPAHEEYEHTVR